MLTAALLMTSSHSEGTAAALVVEKKLSLFENALKHNPKDDTLIAEYLHLCRSKLDLAEVETRWKKTMFTHTGSTRQGCMTRI